MIPFPYPGSGVARVGVGRGAATGRRFQISKWLLRPFQFVSIQKIFDDLGHQLHDRLSRKRVTTIFLGNLQATNFWGRHIKILWGTKC